MEFVGVESRKMQVSACYDGAEFGGCGGSSLDTLFPGRMVALCLGEERKEDIWHGSTRGRGKYGSVLAKRKHVRDQNFLQVD